VFFVYQYLGGDVIILPCGKIYSTMTIRMICMRMVIWLMQHLP